MILNLIDFLEERLKPIITACYVVMALIVVWSVVFVDKSHAHTWAEKSIPGFWSLFGLGSCALIILVAWLLGKTGIVTREDYYDN